VVGNLRPEAIPEWGWRLLALFVPTVLALMLRPMPGGACVLVALLLAVLTDALPPGPGLAPRPLEAMELALGGFRDPTVWLVLAAFFISRALIQTGLARRIALTFVSCLGHNTLGLSYALTASDTLLAGMIPSNAARVGGVMLPIARALAELYRSYPGATAGRLGTFLLLGLYQADVMACALFVTGQAGNWLAARQANDLGSPIPVSYATWFLFASVPALASLAVIPALVFRWSRPEVQRTPEAPAFARQELKRLGRPSRRELMVLAVFLTVCGLWMADFAALHTALIALGGVGVLLVSGVLSWEDCVRESAAWDVFIWYGGLVQLGKLLGQAGVFQVFSQGIAHWLADWPAAILFVAVLLLYFYAHYAFASITAHILAMYGAFASVLIAAAVPGPLALFSLAYFSNFAAGLTHYGTTPGPIIFSTGYVPQGIWWRIGVLLSAVNLAIWLTLGVGWWRLMGLW
jgi:DASS family divalent anion:Na+ symporter